jgi:UDP-N-acetylmuramate dehydrogenase
VVSAAGPGEPPGPDLRAALEALGPLATRDEPLGPLTTYQVGGPAAALVVVQTEQDLEAVRRALAGRQVPVLVIGRGSNLLVSDHGFPGIAVRLGEAFEQVTLPGAGAAPRVRAGGAVALPTLARRTVEAGLTGFEWAVGVPGSVGGGVRMNAGGHGSDIAACLTRYRWVDLAGNGGGEDGPERLGLGYRTSTVAPSQVVLWAELELAWGDRETGRARVREIVRWRREHQPGGSNAGSVFTNPPDDSAGRLVDAAGLRGFRMGTATVSPKHANFIQADEGGSADDVRRLIDHVQAVVARVAGVTLRPEVHLVGFAGRENGAGGTRGGGERAGSGVGDGDEGGPGTGVEP